WSMWSLLLSLRQIQDTWKRLYGTMNALQARLCAVANTIKAMRAVVEKALESNLFTDEALLERMQRVEAIFADGKMAELLEILESDTLRKPEKFAYFRGKVLRANRLLVQKKDKLLPLLQVVGEIDAYCSMATTYARNQSSNVRFCFVDF